MGDQNDGLRGLTRFSDNEGDIIWPAWRAELKQRVAFEFGKIGNQIIEGEVKESDVHLGEVTEKINALINALIPRTRAQIQTRSDWMEEFVVSSEEGRELCDDGVDAQLQMKQRIRGRVNPEITVQSK